MVFLVSSLSRFFFLVFFVFLFSEQSAYYGRINIPFNAVTLAVVSLFFHPQQGRGGSVSGRIQSLDLLGCVIFVPGIFMFLLAMQMGGDDNTWNSPTVIGLFVGAGVTLLLFLAWERHRGDEAMIPGNVALRKTVIFTCLFAAMQMGGLTVASYYLPAWFQAIQGVGPLESGVRILPTALSQLVAAGIASGLGKSFHCPQYLEEENYYSFCSSFFFFLFFFSFLFPFPLFSIFFFSHTERSQPSASATITPGFSSPPPSCAYPLVCTRHFPSRTHLRRSGSDTR